MYTLTLSRSERQAIDWVGHRYSHGDELYKELCLCKWEPNLEFWDSDKDITFKVPEDVAWGIYQIGDSKSLVGGLINHKCFGGLV